MTTTSLLWLLLFLPLLVAAVNYLAFSRSPIAALLSFLSSATTFGITVFLLGKTASAEFAWATIGGFSIHLGVLLDRLSGGMMLVVTGIGMLVHLFSLAYMKDDQAKARYFTSLSLFMFSMTGIVLSTNFAMTFMFWELVGLSSFLLIGHWYEKESAANAAKKAFITNRVGDFGFLIGILMLFALSGTLTFGDMQQGLLEFSAKSPAAFPTLIGTAILFIFAGAMGKSAQAPLHVWLPDAMEGPTPVSALIHAATMVAAGVYMLFRLHLAIGGDAFAGFAGDTIAWIGGITSLLAALMATQQDDIKRILAYSTLSQLGYMVMAVGLGGFDAGMFHLFTHAWFKALLFLGSGAIIYACHHEQDIWKMGGLLKKMPLTSLTFIIGFLALIAVPGTSGFFSKEQILETALHHKPALFWIAATVALLTAFYMTRLMVVTFLGKPRAEGADHAHEVNFVMLLPLLVLGVLSLIAGYPFFAAKFAPAYAQPEHLFHFSGLVPMVSLAAVALGVILGLLLYRGRSKDPLAISLFRERFYIDQFYDQFVVRYFQNALAAIVHFIDEFVINGMIVDGLARSVRGVGNRFRAIQNGNLQTYALAFGLGILLVIYLTVFQ